MSKGAGVILAVMLLSIMDLSGCQRVPVEITQKSMIPSISSTAIPDISDTTTFSYPTYPRDSSANPANNKNSIVYIPHRTERVERTIKVYDSIINISADAHIPEVSSLPILE